MSAVVGIDLGTTNTVVAAVTSNRATALANERGERLIPSVVSFHPNGSVIVGKDAKARRLQDAANTVYSTKRLIGRTYGSQEVMKARSRAAFQMQDGPGHAVLIAARGETYTLSEISAFVLKEAKRVAELSLGQKVERAVVTVPANFNDLQRAATKVAGHIAGLEVLRILNEPTAAALAYGYGKATQERIVVYDFGGGTFDVTLLDLAGNVFEVISTAGDMFLGGDDIDQLVAEQIAVKFLQTHRFDPRADRQVFERVIAAAEELKHSLSTSESVTLNLKEIGYGAGGKALDLPFTMTRAEFDTLIAPLVDRSLNVCREALSIARIEPSKLDQVIVVGGSTRIPLVRRKVAEFFGRKPLDHLSPDEVVAFGAAIQASALTGTERKRSMPPPGLASPDSSTRGATGTSPLAASNRPQTLPGVGEENTEVTTLAVFVPDQRTPALPPPRAGVMPGAGATMVSGKDKFETLPPQPSPLAGKRDAVPSDFLLPLVTPDRELSKETSNAAMDSNLAITAEFRSALDLIPGSLRGEEEPAAPTKPRMPPPPPAGITTARMPSAPPPGGARWKNAGLPPVAAPPLGAPLAGTTTARMASAVPPPAPGVPPLIGPKGALMQPGGLPAGLGLAAVAGAAAIGLARGPSVRPGASHPAPLLLDVTPLSLSVETVGGFCDVIIDRNTPVPCERTRLFATAADNQASVRVRVAQGESNKFGENVMLGHVELSGLRPAQRGEVQIAVTFELDADGILDVHALDQGTGKKTSAKIRLGGAVPAAGDIDAMRQRIERR